MSQSINRTVQCSGSRNCAEIMAANGIEMFRIFWHPNRLTLEISICPFLLKQNSEIKDKNCKYGN
jgi:hypothetical protein